MSATATLVQVFTEPSKAMAAVRERSMLALPLLLMILGNVALFVWYFQIVDFPWLQDAMLSANPAMDASAREVARGFMSKSVMLGSTVTGIVIVVPIMLLASAVYYLLFAKVVGCDIGFGKWFAFATWSAVPTLLLLPLMAMQIILSSNGQLTMEALNPVTLNQLLFHLPTANPWAGLLNAINLTSIWATVVAVIGLRQWTGKRLGTSIFIVLLPQLVIYGAWAIFAATRAAA